ncbi:hypothetical protein N7I30_16445 [Aurantimonas litoralis]|nr:hypothetical protein [Aurantimonas litoralis]
MGANNLASKIAAAERERAAWEAGRQAFRAEGAEASNPYTLHSPDHSLWSEGFEAERRERQMPRWLDAEVFSMTADSL